LERRPELELLVSPEGVSLLSFASIVVGLSLAFTPRSSGCSFCWEVCARLQLSQDDPSPQSHSPLHARVLSVASERSGGADALFEDGFSRSFTTCESSNSSTASRAGRQGELSRPPPIITPADSPTRRPTHKPTRLFGRAQIRPRVTTTRDTHFARGEPIIDSPPPFSRFGR